MTLATRLDRKRASDLARAVTHIAIGAAAWRCPPPGSKQRESANGLAAAAVAAWPQPLGRLDELIHKNGPLS